MNFFKVFCSIEFLITLREEMGQDTCLYLILFFLMQIIQTLVLNYNQQENFHQQTFLK